MVKIFDDVISSNEYKYETCCNFKNYSRFLKSPIIEIKTSSWEFLSSQLKELGHTVLYKCLDRFGASPKI